jgi:FMN-dependent NADH-azoreductase
MKLLHVDSSILGAGSVSRELSTEITASEQRRDPQLEVTYRDLAADPIDHLSGAHIAARDGASPEAAGQAALDEFLAADIVVIGAPMYNFGVPSQLKAWIDRLAVAGKTFRYTEKGSKGLAGGKRLIVASSRGGVYSGESPYAAFDHQENYLRGVFGFLGVTDIKFIRAEGVAMGPEHREKAIAAAKGEIALIPA